MSRTTRSHVVKKYRHTKSLRGSRKRIREKKYDMGFSWQTITKRKIP